MRGRTARHRIKPSRKAVRDQIAGLDALYRPATEAERILDAFAEGASLESLRAKYPQRDVDVIVRQAIGGEP